VTRPSSRFQACNQLRNNNQAEPVKSVQTSFMYVDEIRYGHTSLMSADWKPAILAVSCKTTGMAMKTSCK